MDDETIQQLLLYKQHIGMVLNSLRPHMNYDQKALVSKGNDAFWNAMESLGYSHAINVKDEWESHDDTEVYKALL